MDKNDALIKAQEKRVQELEGLVEEMRLGREEQVCLTPSPSSHGERFSVVFAACAAVFWPLSGLVVAFRVSRLPAEPGGDGWCGTRVSSQRHTRQQSAQRRVQHTRPRRVATP